MRRFWIVMLAVVILGGVFCAIQWKHWFVNQPEISYLTPSVPDRITLTCGEDGQSQRTISWRCDSVLHSSFLRLVCANETICYDALGHVVATRAGKSAYYRVQLDSLFPAAYRYQVCTNGVSSNWYSFSTFLSDSLTFVVFGDIQDEAHEGSDLLFSSVAQRYPKADFWAFAGDIIERPTDFYWQLWFDDMGIYSAERPILACTGNHEYLKGIRKKVDSRWIHIFGNPDNGSSRWAGRTYYVDFPLLRYIVIDTDALQSLSDYTVANAWLKSVLRSDSHKFKIVMMHHPVYAAGMGRFNPLIYTAFAAALKDADLVLQGHDHSYARRCLKTNHNCPTTPIYMVTTTSAKSYLPKCSPEDDKVCCGHRLYQYICLSGDTLRIKSFLAENHQLYDDFAVVKVVNEESRVVDYAEYLPEQIDLPERYKDKSSAKIRRFRSHCAKRMQKQH